MSGLQEVLSLSRRQYICSSLGLRLLAMDRKAKGYRRKRSDSASLSEDDDCNCVEQVELVKKLQKLRQKPSGISLEELAHGKEAPQKKEFNKDPLKLQTGGIIDLKKLKRSDWNNADVEEGLKQQFSKESHLRDEDEEMRKFVEEELSKRKGSDQTTTTNPVEPPMKLEDSLYELPDHLKKYQSKRSEDMLSNQMLCGIPEVDLGIEAKIRNIEETEAAKLRLLREAVQKKKTLESATTARQNVVKDLAQNYVQHSIYKIDMVTDLGGQEKPIFRPRTDPVPVVADDTPRWVQDGKVIDTPDVTLKVPRPAQGEKHKKHRAH